MGSGTAIIWMRGNQVHFEILVEDQSGKKALDILIPKFIGPEHSNKGRQAIGVEKSLWAEKITPHMDVNNNASPHPHTL